MEKICIASDHAGFMLKRELTERYSDKYELEDLGTYTSDSCDYPVYAEKLVHYVLENDCRGVLICGTGIGMSIAANRHKKIRAALCSNAEMAEMSRRHNDANVLVLGAKVISPDEACECLEKFMTAEFEGGRHQRRIDLLDK